MNALIAEDSEVTRDLLQRALAKWGYEVTTACDGNEALEVFSSDNPPRLAILDCVMPGGRSTSSSRRQVFYQRQLGCRKYRPSGRGGIG